MGTVMIDLPDDRLVHIIVGNGGFAITDDRARVADEPVALARRRRPLLTVTGGVLILAFGFVLGQHTIRSHTQAEALPATAANSVPGPVGQAYPLPGQPLPIPPSPPTSANGQVPPALAQQLTQPPQVVPAPGAPPPAAPPPKSPFGLDD